jgi:hypothetical protein
MAIVQVNWEKLIKKQDLGYIKKVGIFITFEELKPQNGRNIN